MLSSPWKCSASHLSVIMVTGGEAPLQIYCFLVTVFPIGIQELTSCKKSFFELIGQVVSYNVLQCSVQGRACRPLIMNFNPLLDDCIRQTIAERSSEQLEDFILSNLQPHSQNNALVSIGERCADVGENFVCYSKACTTIMSSTAKGKTVVIAVVISIYLLCLSDDFAQLNELRQEKNWSYLFDHSFQRDLK